MYINNMDECDEAWLSFCDNGELDSFMDDEDSSIGADAKKISNTPKSTDIYISTKTKIAYLTEHIDLKECFWKINVMPYSTQGEGVVKKQMKFNFTDEEDVLVMQEKLKCEDYYDDQIITHIRNPDGKIKFKDIRKISVGPVFLFII